MHFYLQFGLGYGQVSGQMNEGQTGGVDRHAVFGSGAYGSLVGMGADFCFTASQCFSFEGDYRYLSFVRNIVSSSSNNFASGSLSQATVGLEAEVDGTDMALNMGGLMFMAGYHYMF